LLDYDLIDKYRMTQYSDIDLNFSRNPVTNDVSILIDASAIKAAVKNLILTDAGERPFNPTLGSSIRGLLFEPATPIISSAIESRIKNVLSNFEPRIVLLRVEVIINPDRNSFDVTIGFRMTGDNRTTLVPITLKRLR
jgi:phage baseplate assembly protein W